MGNQGNTPNKCIVIVRSRSLGRAIKRRAPHANR